VIAVDTNVLARFLVADDEAQAAAATAAFAAADRQRVSLFVSQIVLCELVWVLARAYRQSRPAIVGVLESLLRSRGLEVEGRDEVGRAVVAFASGKGDFADYLVRERSRAAGCESVLTFDAALLKEDGFIRPSGRVVSA
jgi:predicted nucleic-acid-binding protein